MTTQNLLTLKEVSELIAERMAVSVRQVSERYVHLPDFPKAVELPLVNGSSSRKRYHMDDINAWLMKYRVAA